METCKPGVSEMNEANALVNGDRQADYGTPRENYLGIAKVWSGILSPILKRDITPEEAALLMVGLKLQRQAMKHKRDNLVDAHGYLLVYAHIVADPAGVSGADRPPRGSVPAADGDAGTGDPGNLQSPAGPGQP